MSLAKELLIRNRKKQTIEEEKNEPEIPVPPTYVEPTGGHDVQPQM